MLGTALPALPALEVVSQLLRRHAELLKGLLVPCLEGALSASAQQQLSGSVPGAVPQGCPTEEVYLTVLLLGSGKQQQE